VEAVTSFLAGPSVGRKDEPPHFEDHLGQCPEKLLMPAIAAQRNPRLLDKVAADRGSATMGVQVADGVLDMYRPPGPFLVKAQPVVQAKGVQVGVALKTSAMSFSVRVVRGDTSAGVAAQLPVPRRRRLGGDRRLSRRGELTAGELSGTDGERAVA
jgi:hypothetical protein